MSPEFSDAVKKIVNDYIERLKKLMNGIPEKERDEFVKEIESHIYESYMNQQGEDDVQSILNVLNKLGEPAEVYSKRVPENIVSVAKEKKWPMYILGGTLIGLFGIPLGLGGIGIIIGIMGVIFGLLVAYYATAFSLILAGFLSLVVSIVRMVDPTFLEQFIEYSDHWFYFSSPLAEGIIGIGASIIIAGLGLAMLILGKHIFRGFSFLTKSAFKKIKEFKLFKTQGAGK